MFFFIQILWRGGGIIKAELNRGPRNLVEPLQIGNQVLDRIVLVQYTVHPEGDWQAGKQIVIRLHHIVLHMAGYIDTGNLLFVFLQKSQDVLFRLVFGHRQSGIDINFMGGRNLVQHDLQGLQVCKWLAAGKDKVAAGRDGIHPADAIADFLH